MNNNHIDETVRRMLANAKPMPVQGQPVQLAAANAAHEGVLIPLQGQAANLKDDNCRAWWRAHIATQCMANLLMVTTLEPGISERMAATSVLLADILISALTKEAQSNGNVS